MSQLQRAGGLDEPAADVCSPVLRRGAAGTDGAALLWDLGCFPSQAPGTTRTAPSWLGSEPPLSPLQTKQVSLHRKGTDLSLELNMASKKNLLRAGNSLSFSLHLHLGEDVP